MNLVRAALFHVQTYGINTSGTFSTGDFKGCSWGTWTSIVFPVGSHEITKLPSSYFRCSYSGFLNLNNCWHSKFDGTLISSQSVTFERLDIPKSVFGPLYQTNQATYSSMVCAGQNAYCEKTVFGNYNQNGEYFWTASHSLVWISGDMFMSIVGYPDVKGSPKKTGRYWIYGAQIHAFSGYYEHKEVTIETGLKTTSCTVADIVGRYQTQVRVQLDAMEWRQQGYTNFDVIPGCTSAPRIPNLSTLHLENAFPAGETYANIGDLAAKAYASTQFFSGNGAAFLGDLATLKSSATTTAALVSKLTGAGASLSVIAKIFLAFHYGWRLFASDCRSLSEAIDRYTRLTSRNSRCSANTTIVHGTRTYIHHFTCYYIRDYQVSSSLDKVASMLDLPLSLNNIWDLIPFSFVADWFGNLSYSLESLDSYYRMTQKHKIICTGQSLKCKAFMTGSQAAFTGWQGSCIVSSYQRTYTSHVIYPSLILDNQTHPLQHIVEGGALIVSKR